MFKSQNKLHWGALLNYSSLFAIHFIIIFNHLPFEFVMRYYASPKWFGPNPNQFSQPDPFSLKYPSGCQTTDSRWMTWLVRFKLISHDGSYSHCNECEGLEAAINVLPGWSISTKWISINSTVSCDPLFASAWLQHLWWIIIFIIQASFVC